MLGHPSCPHLGLVVLLPLPFLGRIDRSRQPSPSLLAFDTTEERDHFTILTERTTDNRTTGGTRDERRKAARLMEGSETAMRNGTYMSDKVPNRDAKRNMTNKYLEQKQFRGSGVYACFPTE